MAWYSGARPGISRWQVELFVSVSSVVCFPIRRKHRTLSRLYTAFFSTSIVCVLFDIQKSHLSVKMPLFWSRKRREQHLRAQHRAPLPNQTVQRDEAVNVEASPVQPQTAPTRTPQNPEPVRSPFCMLRHKTSKWFTKRAPKGMSAISPFPAPCPFV